MKSEKENLIRDLLDSNSTRETTLLAGTRILRLRRQWRIARNATAILAVIVVGIAAYLIQRTSRSSATQISKVIPRSQPSSEVRALTDDELLALFPNTPVGLASLPDGKKKLIFPRPGDEAKFITRL